MKTKREIPLSLLGDAGWRGALHILSCPLLEHKGVWSYVDPQKRTFAYDRMLEDCGGFSSGEYRMLQVAASLFNQETKVNLWELANGLDHDNLLVVLDAIAVSAFGLHSGSRAAFIMMTDPDIRDLRAKWEAIATLNASNCDLSAWDRNCGRIAALDSVLGEYGSLPSPWTRIPFPTERLAKARGKP